jgi:signal transduction histidine kinase
MGEARTRDEAYPPLPRPERRPSTGSRVDPSTATSSMTGWVQSARKGSESERTIREMAAMLELSAALLRADTAADAVRGVVRTCRAHLHVPLVGLLPDPSGTGWFIAAARGVGVKRAEIARSIDGVSALRQDRATRNRLAARFARVAGRARAVPIAAGEAVLLGLDLRPDQRSFLRTAGSLLSVSIAQLGEIGWERIRSDNLDLALACTAHELKGPLVGARAALQHVQIDDEGPTSGELLEQTRDELDQLADLVDPLLQWSAGSAELTIEPSDLVETVEHVVASCRMEFEDADVRVRAPDALVVMADQQQLDRAIANLVRNALTYAPSGSSVSVDVDADDVCARVRVRDRGPGVRAAERRRIFDPFARGQLTDDTRGGKGLGLFIAKRIIEAHGGSIGLRSVRPGTEFCIELPLPEGGRLRSAS